MSSRKIKLELTEAAMAALISIVRRTPRTSYEETVLNRLEQALASAPVRKPALPLREARAACPRCGRYDLPDVHTCLKAKP